MTARDDLAGLMLSMYKIEPRTRALEMADAIIAAGWVFDGSCRDCQANLDTNGGQHAFHCQTPEGKAQWPAECGCDESDEWVDGICQRCGGTER